MKYYNIKTLYDLNSKIKQIIFFIILEIILLIGITLVYKNTDINLINLLYGNFPKDSHILLILSKIFLIAFNIYIVYYLIMQDIIYSKINIFTRTTSKKWYLRKSISILITILIYKIINGFVNIIIIFVTTKYFEISLINFGYDIIFTINIFILILIIVVNKNNIFSIIYLLILVINIVCYWLYGFNDNIIYLFLLNIILWIINKKTLNLAKNSY